VITRYRDAGHGINTREEHPPDADLSVVAPAVNVAPPLREHLISRIRAERPPGQQGYRAFLPDGTLMR
jgi:hypothetical protein